jgi:hypothetical protein
MSETFREKENPARGHETTDANIRNIWLFGLGLFLVIVVSLVVVMIEFNYFAAHQELGPPASPFEDTRQLPSANLPSLQVSAPRDMEQFRKAEEETLHTYGWMDQKEGIVRIPIDRAMDLLIQQGLPFETQPSRPTDLQQGAVQQYTVPQGYAPTR